MGVKGCFVSRCGTRNDGASKVNLFWDCSTVSLVQGLCEDPDEIGRRSNPILPYPNNLFSVTHVNNFAVIRSAFCASLINYLY